MMQQNPIRRIKDIAGGIDILRNIFSFDNTYKNIHTNTVLPNIWKAAWSHWCDYSPDYLDPIIAPAMDWVFINWGIFTEENPVQYYKRAYLPSDIHITKRSLNPLFFQVNIYFKGEIEYTYYVVNRQEYEGEYAVIDDDNESRYSQFIDVYNHPDHNYIVLMDAILDFRGIADIETVLENVIENVDFDEFEFPL